MGTCGGVGCTHTPTYTRPPLAVDLFSVDSLFLSKGPNTQYQARQRTI